MKLSEVIKISKITCACIYFFVVPSLEQAGQASKSATIEMYAPSSYNDTMTGETLSSVSEKSETYSADEGVDDRLPPPIPEVPSMQNRHILGQVRKDFF